MDREFLTDGMPLKGPWQLTGDSAFDVAFAHESVVLSLDVVSDSRHIPSAFLMWFLLRKAIKSGLS